jgi:hypothetical protein
VDSVKINTSKTLTLTLPSDPASNTVTVNLYHEYGDLVKSTTATRVSAGVYTVTFGQEASGIYLRVFIDVFLLIRFQELLIIKHNILMYIHSMLTLILSLKVIQT